MVSKRVFDLILSLIAIFILWLPMLLIAAIVCVLLGTPVLFCQIRPGLHGRPFTMFKFRTMIDAYDSQGLLLPDAQRLTPFGRFLRSTSLDELPELINVLRGEMSLVGPRPLLMEYLDLYTVEQMRRHDVLPGITGWAAVNWRNAFTWEEKFQLDIWYVEHQTLWLDIKILGLTLWKVLLREGVKPVGRETVEKFHGGHSIYRNDQ